MSLKVVIEFNLLTAKFPEFRLIEPLVATDYFQRAHSSRFLYQIFLKLNKLGILILLSERDDEAKKQCMVEPIKQFIASQDNMSVDDTLKTIITELISTKPNDKNDEKLAQLASQFKIAQENASDLQQNSHGLNRSIFTLFTNQNTSKHCNTTTSADYPKF